jgi:cyclopropane-fatty-acyl-phospholipid synthase
MFSRDIRDFRMTVSSIEVPSGIGPLPPQYAELVKVKDEWRWSGTHYQRAARDWLAHFDAHGDEIEPILRKVHHDDTALWMRRWRWFFLATAGLFGYADGSEWGVSHYRMKAA